VDSQILIFIAFLLVIGVGAYLSYLAQQRRRKAMAALAAELGWQFDPSKDRTHDERYHQFEVFRKGHSRYAYNSIRGVIQVADNNWPVQMGDYHYKVTSGSGKNRSTRTYQFSYIVVETPFVALPNLEIRSEGVLDKLASFIGFDDIDFESAEFSDRFHVKSSDKKFAYDVVHPRMMEFLLTTDPPTVELAGHISCFYEENKRWSPEQFRSMLTWSEQFFGHWPNHVLAALDN